MANPFNTATELLDFTSFIQGDSRTVTKPVFKLSQIQLALQMARDEIFDRTLGKENDEFTSTRLGVIKTAEKYLAASSLYVMWGDRLGLLSTDANIVGAGPVNLGADTPPPLGPGSKMEFFIKNMANAYHSKGISLLIGKPFEIGLGTDMTDDIRFPCLSRPTVRTSERWVCGC